MEGTIGKILIVDDDKNIAEVIKMYLESSGYATKTAYDGRAAQEAFLSYKPDLVLLDVMLPYIDGIDVLKWIRKDYETPVIMLTAKGETFDKVLGLELGADDYVVKPFEPKEIIARVKA
ncbi:MAG: response regulator, partial [Clostridium sp.]